MSAPTIHDPGADERGSVDDGSGRVLRRARVRDASVPLRKLIPNMVTAAALCAGVASMHFAALGQFDKAMIAIVVAFVLDGFDGRLARMLKVTSRFGETFDSIADFTAFGLAPAFLVYHWLRRGSVETSTSIIGAGASVPAWLDGLALMIVTLYVICAAFRLARFTVQARKKRLGAPVSGFFQGMPAPAAGGAVLIPPMLELSPTVGWHAPAWLVLAYLLTISMLMISTIPMISIKGVRVSRRLALPLMLMIAVLALGLVRDGWLTGAVVFGLYLLSFPLAIALHARRAAPGPVAP